ncbi:sensor histidine kinase [Pedobacter insulae]|uniref:Oxygen sensor histidine kinase NreB n=1 Tax=Pedobacter insulae TaxID=414048 RepID=A0A1I2YW91_9SPHI|nr:ATP-binding protein [Pedobacter insulae]SFH29730.1 Signal transduction histidine kinase [Pedobacter insulae]
MSFQNSDLFAIITIVSITILIAGISMPFFVVLYFRKKRLHIEEKMKMNEQFKIDIIETNHKAQAQLMQSIASDLHDNLGQTLSLSSITLSSINLEEIQKSKTKIDAALSMINNTIKETRDLAKLLYGEQTLEKPLGEAIEELALSLKTGGYNLTLNNQILEADNLFPEKDIIILRILQEIMNNIVRHAHATHIELNTQIAMGNLSIRVKDDGLGFDPEKIYDQQKIGIGLHSIQRRIKLLAGKITIHSTPLKGTIINIQIPYT